MDDSTVLGTLILGTFVVVIISLIIVGVSRR